MSTSSIKPSVLIIGAGELGAATAVSLIRSGGYGDVTVIDRAQTLPAMDAASCDMNKVVRFDYAGWDYASLAKQSIDEWVKPEWKGIFHQSGCVVRGMHKPGQVGKRVENTYANVVKLTDRARLLTCPSDFTELLAPRSDIPVKPPTDDVRGYHNPLGGWANASAAVEKLYEWIREGGGKLVTGADLAELVYSDGKTNVIGARCKDGRVFYADKVVIALGAWSGSHPAIKGMLPDGLVTATGQTVAAIQLSPEQHERYKGIPVSMHHDGSGYYSFPPNERGIIKFALHRAGYLPPNGVPRTATDPSAINYAATNAVGWIPSEALRDLKEQLASVYPELAEIPVTFTRMCYYSDVKDGDWVIDVSPKYPSLVFATGGAGHAFKFLPIIGDLVRARMENRLAPHLAQKWRVDRQPASEDPARVGMQRKPLQLEELATVAEMRGLREDALSAQLARL